jgi:hypothetical protein
MSDLPLGKRIAALHRRLRFGQPDKHFFEDRYDARK